MPKTQAKPKAKTKKTALLTVAERKQIDAKFGLTPEKLAAELVEAEKPAKKKKVDGKAGPALAMSTWGEATQKFYPDFPIGKFEGEPYLVWVKPDIFRMEPQTPCFRFIRSTGEVIEPGLLFTDGG
ncbi:MAG: hypothetical protein Q8M46_03765 [Thiobacillus sp.]|nr:hypothetical protein [Thiobacillus sp.]